MTAGAPPASRLPRAAVAVVLGALLLKLALLVVVHAGRPQGVEYIDTGTYLRPARALLAHGVFSPSPERVPEPEINRTPGYPALVALLWGLFGERTWLLSLLGALASAGTGLAAAALATRLAGPRAGTLAAAIASLDPGSFVRSIDLLTDSTFTFLFVASLALLVRAIATARARDAGAAGLVLALATLVRPISYYAVPVLAAVAGIAAARRDGAARRGAAAAAAFLAAPLLLLGGWQVRNGIRAGSFQFSPIAGSELLFYRAAPVLARVEGRPLLEVQEGLGNRERWWRQGGAERPERIFPDAPYEVLFPETSRLSLAELGRRWGRQGVAILAAHPFEAAAMTARGSVVLLLVPSSFILGAQHGLLRPTPEAVTAWENQEFGRLARVLPRAHPVAFAFAVLLVLLNGALALLALRGIARIPFRRAGGLHAPLLAALLYLVPVSSGAESIDDRYRLPLVPLLAVYAAAALARPGGPAAPTPAEPAP